MAKMQRNTILVVLSFFAIYFIWGSTYLWNKIAVTELPAFMLAGIRFVIAGSLIFVISKVLGFSLKITKLQFKNTFLAGFLFLTFGNGVVVWALKFVDSGFAALEVSAQPLVVLLMMRVFQGKKIQPMSIVGVILGVAGINLLVGQKEIIAQDGAILGMVLIFLCMLSWSYGSLFVGSAELPKNFFVNTGYQMLTSGFSLLIISLVLGEQWSSPVTWSTPVLWSMSLLIIFGSIVTFTAFNYLLRIVSPEKVATSSYVNPIIAMILGWYFLNEDITIQSAIASVVLLTGVYFINTKKSLTIFSRFSGKRIPKAPAE
ncbi:drug/metabolite transporter (DMT)-like permease [Maribacter spongiicola]|uniref:Drug/metabolite transporter (DMT)-like permease n=1 Tax=Maribacter spongiicola TaxID=1206753 RepID=A0A4V3ERJ8_9FLAO|nr:EamA family transporter [Maribacter spongiicola]TDT45238.1 drug/metabolite transporter (DMT)-like permease [Maribacter spongiicola]